MNTKQFTDWLERQSQSSLVERCENQASVNGDLLIEAEKPLIMGILNVTPDSFSDGGQFLSIDNACQHALHLIAEGADLIDVGGESTKPGAEPVPIEVELSRVVPVIQQIRIHSDICISIDTNKPEVMEAAVRAGADVINDVFALRTQGSLSQAAKLGVPVCLMHMQGEPQTMQHNPHYPDGVVTEVMRFFAQRIAACEQAGIDRRKIILDPGFGFGKQAQDNLRVVKKLNHFALFGMPLLLGVSRKSTIGSLLTKRVGERLIGSIAVAVYAALKGVGILRTHDVDETHQALHLIDKISQVDIN